MKSCSKRFAGSLWAPALISASFIAASVSVFALLPDQAQPQPAIAQAEPEATEEIPELSDIPELDDLFFQSFTLDAEAAADPREDEGLALYRQSESRSAVEWFYTQVVGSRDIAVAVLESADKYDVPVALAFSLAHTESNYKADATHVNKNETVDRGLFQLNSASFPKLTEEDFFSPEVSSRYGMSHLRYCLDTAGNEIAALAMYNAGTNKVRNNGTPQRTLNYISQIETYRTLLEDTFDREVVSYYNGQPAYRAQLVAYK